MDTTPQSEYDPMGPLTLLCERCGYVVEDIDPNGPCPECGKPIVESMKSRPGTPWQQHASIPNLLRTWWVTVRHPKRTLDTMTLHDDPGANLTSASIFSGAGSVVLLCLFPLIFFRPIEFFLFLAAGMVPGMGLGWLVLFTLTATEAMGLRFIARRRGFRIDENISWSIVGHGSVGWVIMGASFTLGVWTTMLYGVWWEAANRPGSDPIGVLLRALIFVFFVIGMPLGFLFFEFFAWMGLRRCKYANHPARSSAGATTSQKRAATVRERS